MFFKFKNGLANCNEWQVWEQQNLKDTETLYLMFPNYTKSIDLKAGVKDYILSKSQENYVDLTEWEL